MNRRPDWHPSYGTPIPSHYRRPTLTERTTAVRDRLGIEQPRTNYKLRAWSGVMLACSSLFFLDGPILFGLLLDALAVWSLWPCLRDADDILG